MFCYVNANLTRDEQSREVLRFVDDGHDLTGRNPQRLYVDLKLTTYAELSELNAREVFFVTIRRRSSAIVKRLQRTSTSDWKSATMDIPKRRHQRIRYLDESLQLDEYDGRLRQIAVTGLGREQQPPRGIAGSWLAKWKSQRDGVEEILVLGLLIERQRSEIRLLAQLGDAKFGFFIDSQVNDRPRGGRREGLGHRGEEAIEIGRDGCHDLIRR